MKLIIACPIYKRDWILPYWISHIVSQDINIENVGFIFEAAPDDIETIEILEKWKNSDSRIPHFEINVRSDLAHHEHKNNGRQWTMSKYENMVSLRNSILNRVRELQPDYYFSLDSDILLLNKNTINLLIAHINDGADAVNTLSYMTPVGTNYPSVMSWKEGQSGIATRSQQYPIGSFFRSDVIMASKMMSKKVYSNVDYRVHRQGEDVGWSQDAGLMGYKLFCASYIYTAHIMSRDMLQSFLYKGDERNKLYDLV